MPKDINNMDIKEIIKLTPAELADVDIYGHIGEKVLEIETHSLYKEGAQLSHYLEGVLRKNPQFKTKDSKLYKRYKGLITWLKFLRMETLLDSELYEIMANHLVEALTEYEVEVREKIRVLYKQSWDPFLRGEKRDMILRAFSENNERLGKYMIESHAARRNVHATVKNIILDYNGFVQNKKERGSLEELGYLDSSPQMRGRTSRERELVLKVLQVYDFVRYPPVLEMAREMVVSPIKITGQQIEKRGLPQQSLQTPHGAQPKKVVTSLDPLDILKQKYHSYRVQRQQVLKLEDEILIKTKGDIGAIKKELSAASRNNDAPRVIACLKIFARQGALTKALRSSPAWIEAVGTYFQKQYERTYSEPEVLHAASTLRADPTTPAALSEFLQYILKEKLQMSENDSALVGVEVSQLMGGQYQSIAFGNQTTGSFEWAKGEIKNNELVIKSE